MASSKKSSRRRSRRAPSDFLKFIALSVVAGFVTAGLVIPPAAALGLTANASINWFKGLPDDMSDGPLSQPSVFEAKDGTELASFYSENRTEVPLNQISQHMVDAQLSIEDRDFYHHGGVDGVGILRAIANNFVGSSGRQGASTITQQYVNNLLIDSAAQNGGDASATMGANKGMMDKIKEMKLSVSMEQNKSKDEILNGYLNVVNYGGANYGVEAAAYHYWGIKAKDLSVAQSALLAGMVQSPTYYDPVNNPDAAKDRRNTVLGTMKRDGKISDAEYQEAKDAPLDLHIHTTESGCAAAKDAPYFCDYVRNLVLNGDSAKMFGSNDEERLAALTRGGLKIKTTLDLKAQREAQKQVEATQPIDNNPDDVNTALVSVEPGTGNILSMAQNSHYSSDDGNQNTEWNYAVNTAMGGMGGFQPGSTFKPFTLAEWIKEGNGVDATIDATSLDYPAGFQWNASCKPGGKEANPGAGGRDFTFHNAEDGWQRDLSVREGIYNSVNSALYATASYVDLCGIGSIMKALHVTANGQPIAPQNALSNLLGAADVDPLTMANAFATYASEGKYCAPRSFESITKRNGQKIDVPAPKCNQAIDKNVANGVSNVLKDVLVKGSGYQRGIGLEDASAAKTGTNDNSSQTWFTGYTRGLATASWVGSAKAKSRSLNNLSINGTSRDYVDGSQVAGSQWQNYMKDIAPNYNTDKFTSPSQQTLGTEIKSKRAS